MDTLWRDYVVALDNDTVIYGLGTYLVILGTLFFGSIPFMALDFFKFPRVLYQYKIQPSKTPSSDFVWLALQCTLRNQLMIVLPGALIFAPYLKSIGMEHSTPLPSLATIALQIAVMFVVDDLFFYFAHRWLHTPWAYRRFHKLHHTFYAPFALTANATHPVEQIIQSIGTMAAVLLVSPHLFTFWAFLVVRLLQGIDDHTGYDFPWNPLNFIPFVGGTSFHDWHHSKNIGNYSSCFTFFDSLFGTDAGYR